MKSSVASVDGINGKIAAEEGNVRAYGDVDDSDSESDDYTITAVGDDEYKAKVDLLGDLTSSGGEAIQISGENVSVIVQGDVKTTAEDGKIFIDASDSDGTNNEIAIGGVLKNGKNGATLAVATNEDDVDEEKLPEIVVGTIEDISKLEVTDSNGDALSKEEAKKVIDNIKYIIDRNDLQNGMLTITTINGGTWEQTDSAQIYKVAKAGETFKVKINVADGYELSAGNAKVERNADGSYTVTVPEGGLDLYAMLKAITATVTRSSSGGGSGSSSSGLHAIAVTPGAGRTNVPTTPGSWKKNADNTWSYVNADGSIYKSSWIVSNNRWYYADANGRIVTSWMEINGVWYYFSVADSTENPEGSMLAGTTTPDGYKLDSNGAWVK